MMEGLVDGTMTKQVAGVAMQARLNGRICPVLVCQECDQPVKELAKANVCWPMDGGDGVVLHKACDQGRRGPHYKQRSLWMQADVWAAYLLANAGVRTKQDMLRLWAEGQRQHAADEAF